MVPIRRILLFLSSLVLAKFPRLGFGIRHNTQHGLEADFASR
jgi:hypothetical protein